MTIPTISTLPTAPARTDPPATFVTRADSFLAALVTMQSELNTSIGAMNTDIAQVNTDATTASTAATNAAASAAAADAASNATLWVSGTSYSAGDVVYSPIDYLSYRANTATSGTTDPSESNDWTVLSGGDVTLATLTQTLSVSETTILTLGSALEAGAPVVSATKEIPQTGVTNNNWDAAAGSYELEDSAYDTTLAFSGGNLVLGTGSFASTDVGKTINVNDGVLILTATDGSYTEATAPSSTDTAASGEWSMFGVVYDATDDVLEVSFAILNLFDSSTLSFTQSLNINAQGTEPTGIAFNTDGTKMFISNDDQNEIDEYVLSTGFDISTASYIQSFSVSSQTAQPTDVNFNSDGTIMIVLGEFTTQSMFSYNLTTGFDLSTASYSGTSFSVGSQETEPRGMTFSPSGTKMYVVGRNADNVNEYTLSTAFDISTASFVQSFSVGSQETFPRGVAFSTDGTKMFVVGESGDDVNEYALSTGFDISTASFVSNTSVNQNTEPSGIAFNNDGSKMFIVGARGTEEVNEYKIGSISPVTGYQPAISSNINTTYWTDINSLTATNAVGDGNVFYAISNDNRDTWSILDNSNGVRDIVRDNAGTWQYNSNGAYGSETWTDATTNTEVYALREAMEGAESVVSSPYDLSAASYSSVSFSVSSQDSQPSGLAFNADGTKMFVVGETNNAVYEYSLSTGFDISIASFVQSFSVSAQETGAEAVTFNTDGTKMFVLGKNSDNVNEYTLSTGFDLSTASFAQSFSVAGQEANSSGLAFNTDGTKMFVVGTTGDDVNEYTLSTGFNVSTASFVDSFSLAGQETNPQSIAFNTTGTKMFITGFSGDDVNEYTLSTGFDVSTASFVQNFSVASQDTEPRDIAFSADGTKMFIVGSSGYSVYQYSFNETIYTNQMDSTALNAITDANQITLGNDLDFAAILYIDSGTTVPTYSGTAINYDANILNQGALQGIDYDFDFPATDKVRITALNAGNYKVRIV